MLSATTGHAQNSDPELAPPLEFTAEPTKRIYSFREGVMVKFILKATRPAKVCLEKDVLTQMQVHISRSGEELPLQPLVVKDNRLMFHQPMKIRWLEPGEQLLFRANLKRFQFAGGETWEPGEYNITATFNLCEQTDSVEYDPAGQEVPIKTEQPGWFMIMS